MLVSGHCLVAITKRALKQPNPSLMGLWLIQATLSCIMKLFNKWMNKPIKERKYHLFPTYQKAWLTGFTISKHSWCVLLSWEVSTALFLSWAKVVIDGTIGLAFWSWTHIKMRLQSHTKFIFLKIATWRRKNIHTTSCPSRHLYEIFQLRNRGPAEWRIG